MQVGFHSIFLIILFEEGEGPHVRSLTFIFVNRLFSGHLTRIFTYFSYITHVLDSGLCFMLQSCNFTFVALLVVSLKIRNCELCIFSVANKAIRDGRYL